MFQVYQELQPIRFQEPLMLYWNITNLTRNIVLRDT